MEILHVFQQFRTTSFCITCGCYTMMHNNVLKWCYLILYLYWHPSAPFWTWDIVNVFARFWLIFRCYTNLFHNQQLHIKRTGSYLQITLACITVNTVKITETSFNLLHMFCGSHLQSYVYLHLPAVKQTVLLSLLFIWLATGQCFNNILGIWGDTR